MQARGFARASRQMTFKVTFCAWLSFPKIWNSFEYWGRKPLEGMSSFFEHQKSSFKRSYLKNLIVLAASDGLLGDEEKSLITKIGLRRGLKAWQIEEMFGDSSQHEIFLPESMANRMNMLYDLMELVYVDRQANINEIAYIKNLLDAFQLKPETMDELTRLFEDGTPLPLDWRDFVDEVCGISVEY
jgi:hypothetical protein